MKSMTLTNPSPDLDRLLDEARDEDLVVHLQDGRHYLVSPIDEFDIEVALTRRNEKLMAFLDARARNKDAAIPFDEAMRQLGLTDEADTEASQDN
jgi:hypothetical protein